MPPQGRTRRFIKRQLGGDADKGNWSDQIDSSISVEENMSILGGRARNMGYGRQATNPTLEDVRRMSAQEIAARSGIPMSNYADSNNLMTSTGNIINVKAREVPPRREVPPQEFSGIPNNMNLQEQQWRRYNYGNGQGNQQQQGQSPPFRPTNADVNYVNKKTHRAKWKREQQEEYQKQRSDMDANEARYRQGIRERIDKTIASLKPVPVPRAVRALAPKFGKAEQRAVSKTMGQLRGRLYAKVRQSAGGLSYGYAGGPNSKGAGRPKGQYKHYIPNVGYVPAEQYRTYLRRLRNTQDAQTDARFAAQMQGTPQVSVQQIQNAPQIEPPKTKWSRTVEFARKDMALMRQEDQFNLMRDMPTQTQYEYTDVNLLSGNAIRRNKIQNLGWF